jgi:hypothetical protein
MGRGATGGISPDAGEDATVQPSPWGCELLRHAHSGPKHGVERRRLLALLHPIWKPGSQIFYMGYADRATLAWRKPICSIFLAGLLSARRDRATGGLVSHLRKRGVLPVPLYRLDNQQ